MKFHKHPSSGSRVVPCGRTDGLADMTKLTVALRNFVKAPKKTGLLDILVNKQRFYRLTGAADKL